MPNGVISINIRMGVISKIRDMDPPLFNLCFVKKMSEIISKGKFHKTKSYFKTIKKEKKNTIETTVKVNDGESLKIILVDDKKNPSTNKAIKTSL